MSIRNFTRGILRIVYLYIETEPPFLMVGYLQPIPVAHLLQIQVYRSRPSYGKMGEHQQVSHQQTFSTDCCPSACLSVRLPVCKQTFHNLNPWDYFDTKHPSLVKRNLCLFEWRTKFFFKHEMISIKKNIKFSKIFFTTTTISIELDS